MAGHDQPSRVKFGVTFGRKLSSGSAQGFSRASCACALSAALRAAAAQNNITVDGHFSKGPVPYNNGGYSIGADLGKQVGGNLFHSFGKFGLATTETATFSGPTTVNNVIGRVTGGTRSDIDGKIQSNIARANLFLINPSGIVFGPNATVNVSGAFHASTADYIKMADGVKFQATHPDGSTLSAAPPAAFGFLTASPAKISVNGSTLTGSSGQTLGLVGGPVSISGAALSPPAGTIHVTSAAGTGEVPVDPRDKAVLTVSNFGPVDIRRGSTLDVTDRTNFGSGGSVLIRSGDLTIDASSIRANNFGSGPGGQLVLRGDHQVMLSGGALVQAVAVSSGSGADVSISTSPAGTISAEAATVETRSAGPGNGGALSIETGKLTLANKAAFNSFAQSTGGGGPITITASSVLLDGGAALDQSTGIFSTTSGNDSRSGSGGPIKINAGQLDLQNDATYARRA
jgi:filamentous hemagglutinin family protein